MALHTRVLISIHDVAPDTLDDTERLIRLMAEHGLGEAILLVVPGLDWQSDDVGRLRRLVDQGHSLAGHGWLHHAPVRGSLFHRVHSALISRDVAEHLALDAQGIRELIMRCRQWFDDQHLPEPALYVPPAWAMGAIRRPALTGLGFRYFETLSGIYDCEARVMHRLPLVGYEADTLFRKLVLRLSNGVNRLRAKRSGWLRIGIHPFDDALKMRDDLTSDLERALPSQLALLNDLRVAAATGDA